jgi:non-homologous end joining protein Ku
MKDLWEIYQLKSFVRDIYAKELKLIEAKSKGQGITVQKEEHENPEETTNMLGVLKAILRVKGNTHI